MTRERDMVEVLVLMDGSRNYYPIPRSLLERCRASGDQRAALKRALEAEAHDHPRGAASAARQAAPTERTVVRYAPAGVLTLTANAYAALGRAGATSHQGGESPTDPAAVPQDAEQGGRS
jgi:hypothetical protein